MPRILVIEDDPLLADELVSVLVRHGFDVDHALGGSQGLRRALTGGYDGITLDRLLPDIDGLTLLKTVRESGLDTPVVMVSALGDVDERIEGLRAGGDDYLVKPFVSDELIARLEALLRRARASARKTEIRHRDLNVDLVERSVRRDGAVIDLLPMEFKILEFMLRNIGSTVTRRMLFENVWGYYFDPGDNVINVHVGRLRRKLDAGGRAPIIVTVRGAGYCIEADA